MARINDPLRENISTIADGDLLPIVDITDATLDKNITMAQIKAFSATDITGKQDLITTPINNDVVLTDVTGQTKDSGVQLSVFTQQGNTFNGVSQLVQLNSTGQLPAVDASLVTGLYDDSTLFALNSGYVNATGEADILAYSGTTLSFKVDNNVSYKPLTLTYADKTQEVLTSLASIIGLSTNGSYTVIKEKGQNPVAVLSSTVTQGKTFPTSSINGDYHCLTATGLQTYKRVSGSWVETQYLPLGSCVISGGVITSVSTNTYNQNGYDVNVQSNDWARGFPNYAKRVSKSADTVYQAECDGEVIATATNQYMGMMYLFVGKLSPDYAVDMAGDDMNGYTKLLCLKGQVSKGEYYLVSTSQIDGFAMNFIPAKGAN